MKRSILVCLVALSALCEKSLAQCASPANIYTFLYGGHTYKIVKEKQTWTDASSCAVTMGGRLVEITSKEENDTVFGAIKNAGIPLNYSTVSDGGGATYVWIGATDKLNEGVWLWDGDNNGQGTNFWNGQGAAGDGNGEKANGQYNNWGGTSEGGASPNEPDDFLAAQDCAGIALDFWPKGAPPPPIGIAGEWNDLNVSNLLYYVVEKNCLDKAMTRDTAICKGERIYLQGDFRTTGGSYYDTLLTPLGCDSIITTNLTILGVDTTQVTTSICQGDTIVIGGTPRTQSGKYFAKYESALGCDSLVATTLTVIPNVTRSRTTAICQGDSLFVGGAYQTQSGTYEDVYASAAGCDSIVTTTLTVNTADTSVTSSGSTLTANATGATYQWIDCDNGNMPIEGATNQSFTSAAGGHYAVIVTQNGCTGVSSCYAATASSVIENSFPTEIAVYPNPARDQMTIDLGRAYGNVTVNIRNINGELIRNMTYRESAESFSLNVTDLSGGTYFVYIASSDKSAIVKVIKQ